MRRLVGAAFQPARFAYAPARGVLTAGPQTTTTSARIPRQQAVAVRCSGSSSAAAPPPAAPGRPSPAITSAAPAAMNSSAAASPTVPQEPLAADAPPAAAAAEEPACSSGRGAQVPPLDRGSFKQVLNVLALRIPSRRCTDMLKAFRGYMLDRPRLRCIVPDGAATDTKLLLLDQDVTLEGLTPELRSLVEAEGLAQVQHAVVLDYTMLSVDAVLKRLLPAGVDAPSAFETIGHIAHLNLREEQLPYRHVIGEVLLDKNPHLKTVVNKVGSIDNEYRVFQMEVIAGEQRLETEVSQHGAKFRLDFSQVYWNSRLESEHLRLVSGMGGDEVLVDMMAGIGPFAVPAAQKGLTVYANDLNPRSAHYMAVNVRINRLGSAVRVFNMDGRAFLRMLCDAPGSQADELRQQQQQQQQKEQKEQQEQGRPGPSGPAGDAAAADKAAASTAPAEHGRKDGPAGPPAAAAPSGSAADASGGRPAAKRQRTRERPPDDAPLPPIPAGFAPPAGGLHFHHVVMNLPASGIEFLDAFSGAFDPAAWAERPLPMVHCYTFKRAAETEADIVAKAERYLGGAMEPGACSVHTVRDVAPNKLMLCLSFRLPRLVAFSGRA